MLIIYSFINLQFKKVMEESIFRLPHTCIDTVYLFTEVTTIFRRLKIFNYKKINLIINRMTGMAQIASYLHYTAIV